MGKESTRKNFEEENEEEDEKLPLTKFITDRRKALPITNTYFDSSHNIVNRERCIRNILPVYRSIQLDELAKAHAESMAAQQCRFHFETDDLMSKVIMLGPCRLVGE